MPRWKKVKAPQVWRPGVGEVLVGHYLGQSVREGSFGEYTVVLIRGGDDKTYMLSGVALVNAVDAGAFRTGEPIAVTFRGHVTTSNNYSMKTFDVEYDEEAREKLTPRETARYLKEVEEA